VYLGIRAYSAVLPKGLYYRNLSLLEGPSCLCATAFYKVSVTDLILAVVELLGRDMSRLIVEVWEALELVEL
jgi:hypothetical protein